MRLDGINIRMAITLLIIVCLYSCGHKEIDCPGAIRGIDIMFEWDNAQNADVDGMTVFFYPIDGYNRVWRFDIAGHGGGRVELPSGIYRMIACNNDLPGITIDDTAKESTIHATATRRIDNGVYGSTGMLYGAVVDELEISPCGVRYTTSAGNVKHCGKGIVRCSPDSLATKYTVNLTNVIGIEHVRSATVRLGTVDTSIFLDKPHHASAPAWLSISLGTDSGRSLMTGNGCAFGPDTSGNESYCREITVMIVMTDGKILSRTFILTPENLNFITAHNVIITVDGMEIPDDGGSAPPGDIGGIDAIVDGWHVIEIDLEPSRSH